MAVATFAVNMLGRGAARYFITRLQERLPPSLYPPRVPRHGPLWRVDDVLDGDG